jgi:hypothetical protein
LIGATLHRSIAAINVMSAKFRERVADCARCRVILDID